MAGPVSVPNVFGAQAGNIPLIELDDNYTALVTYANDPTNRVSVGIDSGVANGYVLTPNPAIPNYSNPFIVWFIPNASNTTTSTANVSGKGALIIFKDTTTGPAALSGGEIIAANWAGLAFDPALNTGAGGFHLLNPVQTGRVAILGNVETGAVATGTNTMPGGNTVPTSSNGDQYMTLTVTPQNPGSTLFIDVVANVTNSAAVNQQTALYQDATANAIASVNNVIAGSGGGIVTQTFRHKMANNVSAGSSTTFKVRSGATTAATTTFNGTGGGQSGGGTFASSITVWEKLP